MAFAIGTTAMLLMVANVLVSAQLSHLGLMLSDLDQQTDQLTQNNQTIRQDIVKNTALTDVEAIATFLGFTKDINYLDLEQDKPIAMVP